MAFHTALSVGLGAVYKKGCGKYRAQCPWPQFQNSVSTPFNANAEVSELTTVFTLRPPSNNVLTIARHSAKIT